MKKINIDIQACLEEMAIAKVIKKQNKKEGKSVKEIGSFWRMQKEKLKTLGYQK